MPKGLSGNQLKLIALVSMTIDHIGAVLLPDLLWLRMVGRLALPVYAYMIAEGCRHTRSMPRYLGHMALMALLCQVVIHLSGSWYQSIFVTFTLSIGLVYLLQKARDTQKLLWWLLVGVAVGAIWFLTQVLPLLLPETDYMVDYDFLGVMLPVMVWMMPTKLWKLVAVTGVLLLMGINNSLQLLALCAIPLLALYSGQRGKYKLKWLFYWYYPVHLGVLQLVGMLWGEYI